MFRSALFVASLLLSSTLLAQGPVLWGYTVGWEPGDQIDFTSAMNPGTVDPGAEGANVVWDFSKLVDDGPYIYNTEVFAPDQTFFGANFPDATYAREPVANDFHYYRVGEESLDYLGYAGFFQTMVLSDPLTLFRFPMEYGDFFTDTAYSLYNDLFGGTYDHNRKADPTQKAITPTFFPTPLNFPPPL